MIHKCATCRFWSPWDEEKEVKGFCLRHAPRPVWPVIDECLSEDADLEAQWPITHCRQECGEWQLKDEN